MRFPRRPLPPVALAALAALAFALPAVAEDAKPAAQPTTGPRTLKFALSYPTKIPAPPEGTKRLEAWIPVPFEDEMQKVTDLQVKASVPYEITKEPTYGNRMIHVLVENPKVEVTVNWTANVQRTEDAGQTGGPVLPRYLESDSKAKVPGKAEALAKELGVDKADVPVRDRAKIIYDDTLAKMTYDKVEPGYGKGDFLRACEKGKGNCSDFAARFITIARAAKIPARWISSISVTDDHKGCSACGYHCYAQFREGDKWVPVDASDARKILEKDPAKAQWYFGHAAATSIVLSVGRDIDLSPKQQAGPVNFFWGPYVEVDGKPFDVPAANREYKSTVPE